MTYSSAELAPFLAELSLAGPIEPFLVFADWLQSRGDPWGELIAIQCQGDVDPAKRRQLETASFGLLARVATVLCPHDDTIGIAWRRGFVQLIAFSDAPPKWLGDELARLLGLPATTLATEVSLAGAGLDDAHVQPLLRSRARLQRLARLDLSRNWFDPTTIAQLHEVFPNARIDGQLADEREPPLLGNSWAGPGDQ